MAFDPSTIGGIGEAATAPVSQAPMRALQLSDLTQQGQMQQLAIKDKKDEQADLEFAKGYISKNRLDLSNPDDQARMVSAMASRNTKLAMSMQRGFAESDMSQVKLKEADLAYHAARLDTMAMPAEHIVETMEDMAKQGKGQQEIQAYGVNAATELLKTLQGKSVGARPVLTKEDTQEALKMLQGPDIYQALKGFVGQSQKAREQYSAYTKNLHEQATTEAAGEKVETVMKGGKPHRVMFDAKGNVKKDLGEAPPSAAMINMQAGSGGSGKAAGVYAAMADLGISFPPGMRSVKAQHETIMGLLQKHPDDTPDQIAQRVKSGELGFAGSKTELNVVARREGASAAAINALNREGGLYDQLAETGAKVDFGSAKFGNAFRLWKQGAAIADPDISEYVNALADTRAEFASVLARGGQVTDSVRIASEHAFPDKMSKEELTRNIERSRKIADAIQSGNTSVADAIIKGTPLEDALKASKTPDPASKTPVPASPSGAAGAGSGPKVTKWKMVDGKLQRAE